MHLSEAFILNFLKFGIPIVNLIDYPLSEENHYENQEKSKK